MSRFLRRFAMMGLGAMLFAGGCVDGPAVDADAVGTVKQALIPSGLIYTDVGYLDVEGDYIPGVVHCELGWWTYDVDALRAQAVAARTYLATRMELSPSLGSTSNPVPIGPSFQCWTDDTTTYDHQAASSTAGVVMSYGGQTIHANYSSGVDGIYSDGSPYPPSYYGYPWSTWAEGTAAYANGTCDIYCLRSYSSYAGTQVFVTNNAGRTGSSVIKTVHNSPDSRNRGGLGQYKAAWLGEAGYAWQDILRYFYGADIVIGGGGGGTEPPDPGSCTSGDGWYCGGNGVEGDANTLYYCAGGSASVVEVCAHGCQANSAGVPDACNPPPSGGPGACSCGGGADFTGAAVPISSTHCGFRVCGGDMQLYECGTSGWVGLNLGCGGGCSCSGGADYAGNEVPASATHCGYRVCGGDMQYYDCGSNGWAGSGEYFD